MKHSMGECERCNEENRFLIPSFEGMVCFKCAEELDIEKDELYND